ncbi:unnamed protein product [Amoebophrya sp. A120]|nr:unnamed protein product [Amoebophrya sp. A120]|eukprot:GSA120T00026079001.1
MDVLKAIEYRQKLEKQQVNRKREPEHSKEDLPEPKRRAVTSFVAWALLTSVKPKQATGTDWDAARQKELDGLNRLKTWVEEQPPPSTPVIPIVLNYTIKADGRKKARAVVLGNLEQIDNEKNDFDCYSPVVSHITIRTMLKKMATENLCCSGFDIENAFVTANLTKRVYCRLPPEWGGKTVRLIKALYGLRSAPRHYSDHFAAEIAAIGWTRSEHDPGLFVKIVGQSKYFLLAYVDDGLILGPEQAKCDELRSEILKIFKGRLLEVTKENKTEKFEYLGLTITHDRANHIVHVSQKKATDRILKNFNMEKVKPAKTPIVKNIDPNGTPLQPNQIPFNYRAVVGHLQFLSCFSRPDLTYSVKELSRHLEAPNQEAVDAAIRVFQYLKATSTMGITFKKETKRMEDLQFQAFSDASFANEENRKSCSGCLVTLGSSPIWWKSKTQNEIAISTCEAEYYALFVLVKELKSIRQLYNFIWDFKPKFTVYVDNKSAIKLAKHSLVTNRTKHIDVRYHFLRSSVLSKEIEIKYIPSKENRADSLTKPTAASYFQNQLGVGML